MLLCVGFFGFLGVGFCLIFGVVVCLIFVGFVVDCSVVFICCVVLWLNIVLKNVLKVMVIEGMIWGFDN